MTAQSVRPSQFIMNYGVGSLFETADGPAVMLDFAKCGLFPDPQGGPGIVSDISKFEVTDHRLSASLLDGAHIFSLPTNEDLCFPSGKPIYSTQAFPGWSVCVQHPVDVIYRLRYDGSQSLNTGCPECGAIPRSEAWRKARREATTFVRACLAGHLDDLPWTVAVRHLPSCKDDKALFWRGTGSSLGNITIECRSCAASESMRAIFTRPWPCSGRFPESRTVSGQCGKTSTVLLKGAANLRVPEIVSALTIPPNDTPLHRILGRSHFQTALQASPISSREDLLALIGRVPRLVRADELKVIQEADEVAILRAILEIKQQSKPQSLKQMKVDEFNKLSGAATYGAPPVQAKHPSMPHWFEVVKTDVRAVPRPGGHAIRVAPVNRLRVVMVQKGYTRPVGDQKQPPDVVDCHYSDGIHRWYPGVELSGEGIFLDFPGTQPPIDGPHANQWAAQFRKSKKAEHHPVFVWWHTYSHRLLTALAVDSGYSAAAIRERVFVEIDEKTDQARGAALLYTCQPGGDGTLGGLVALAPDFKTILDNAERFVDSCSNDPICEETEFRPGRLINGAACYACQMASETSCEHRNTSLDRNILKDNMP